MSSDRERVPFEMRRAEEDELFEKIFGPSDDGPVIVREESKWSIEEVAELRRAVKTEAEHSERARIRTELIEWLVGTILPCDAGLVNGRRTVDEIDRICPKE